MRTVLLPVFVLLLLALACGGSVLADTVEDPLHGMCNGTGTGTCIDNGTNTPLGNSTTFGFSISPGAQTGTLVVDILVPSNYAIPLPFALTTGGGATSLGTASLFSSTAWSSGNLANYLGISASPNNPIGGYLSATDVQDPGAMGFYVFQGTVNTAVFFPGPGGTNWLPFDMIGGLRAGSYIIGFCSSGCGTPEVATANSGALFVPEPSSLVMLFSGLLAMSLFVGRRSLTA